MHVLKKLMQSFGRVLVKVASRLIREKYRGGHDERTGDGDSLLLPS